MWLTIPGQLAPSSSLTFRPGPCCRAQQNITVVHVQGIRSAHAQGMSGFLDGQDRFAVEEEAQC